VNSIDPRLIELRERLAGQVLRGSSGVSYHIRQRIGEGAQGWVFTANWDEPGGFVVIVKVLRPDAITSDALTRFQTEAEVLQRLSQGARPNPYIVRFYDHAVANMRSPIGNEPLVLPFTVLEFVNGPALEVVLESNKGHGLALDRVRRIVRQVSQALEVVHAQKIVHRDLKPSNILLATDAGTETAKVTDFGLVKLTDMNLQRTTTLAGASLGYAPPEQYETGNKRVSPRTDVFSLAAIFYEMLAGGPAFPYNERENALLIITRILKDPRPRLAQAPGIASELKANPTLIDKLDAEIARALHPDPNERHTSVSDFCGAVEPLLRAAMDNPRGSIVPPSKLLPFMETAPAYSRAKVNQTQQSAPEGPTSVAPQVPESRMSWANAGSPSASALKAVKEPIVKPLPFGTTPQPASGAGDHWAFRLATPPLGPHLVRAASIAHDGAMGVGVGPGGFARWDRSWIAMNMPSGVDPRQVRGIKLLRNRDVIMFGDHGLVVRIAPSGVHEVWPIPDRSITFHGIHCDEHHGRFTLVGERPARTSAAGQRLSLDSTTVGTVIMVTDSRVTMSSEVPGTHRLRAVARLLSGALVACGDSGALARIEGSTSHHAGNICPATLNAIEALPDGGALVVGTGGHALYLSPRLEPKLEPVQTTKDIAALALDEEGNAWAGAAQARLLRRTGDTWVRKSGELGLPSSTLALTATSRWVRAICDDGAVIEGSV
jgi:serine/threonine protein kinase